jgi:hypothetical protein
LAELASQSIPFTMPLCRFLLLFLLPIGLAAFAMPACAAGTVELDLVGDMRGSALYFQEWAQLLGKAGVRNVRIRAAQDSDKVGIETQGTAQSPIYVVTGIVRSRDELVMPSGRFRPSDVGRLAQWLNDLAEHGPAAGREKKAAFGLTASQFDRIRQELAAPVGFATVGLSRRQCAERIAGRLKLPLKLDAAAAQALADEKLPEELSELSCGTVLAYVLQSAGYGLLPRADGEPACDVVKARPGLEVWPVGWASEKPAHDLLPALFESLNVNVQNVSAATALDAIAKRLKTPLLIDHEALARNGIDPAKAVVSLPRSRTTYSLALRKLLFQAKMKFEVRCDEAGTPLLWITALKPGRERQN